MRLVQVIGSSGRGGAERFFVRLVTALAARGIEQRVVLRGGHWVEEQVRAAGLPADRAPFSGLLDFRSKGVLRRILTEHRAEAVLSWMQRGAAACPRGPWLHVGRLGNYYDLKYFRSCDHLVGITPGIVEHIKAGGWPPERVSFIANFVPDVPAAPVARASLATPEGVPVILWLGRMLPEKGPDIVVRAMRDVPGAVLWVAGDGPFAPEVRRIADELGLGERVRFLGWRDDIHALAASADILVCASRFEAHGNIILEGWAHGLAVVAARSPGPSHLIDDGVTGLLVANDDPGDMAGALNRLVADGALRRRLGEAGRAHRDAVYGEAAIIERYLDLLQRLLRERRAPAA